MAILKEIAEKAGFSIRTVTRALKDASDINAETREKIKAIAVELQYRPNFAARSLKLKKTLIIGVLRYRTHVDPDNRRIALISEQLSDKGYSLLQGIYHDDATRTKLIARFQDICDAILFSPCGLNESPDDYNALLAQKYPFVILDPCPALKQNFPLIRIDREKGVADAIESLASSGHTRVAFLTPTVPLVNRLDGFKEGLRRLNVPFLENNVIQVRSLPGNAELDAIGNEYDLTMEAGYYTALNHAAVGRDYDALFCYSDALALGCLRGLYERGLRVPQDVSVIGFDNAVYTAQTHVPLSTIAQPISEPASATVEMLLSQLDGKAVTSKVFPTTFIKRQSS